MKLTILGASPSFPNPGGASSSYLIEHDGARVLVDCGHGSVSRLLTVADPRSLDAVVLSHLHADHFFDVVPLTFAYRFRYGGGRRVGLWLPPGGTAFLQGVLRSLGLEWDVLAQHFEVSEYGPDAALGVGSIAIGFAPTNHFVPGFAMRFAPTGSDSPSIGYSSDTGPSGAVSRLLSGVDVALIDATELEHPPNEVRHGHLTAEEAGRMACEAQVGRLLLTHYADVNAEAALRDASAKFTGPIELAREGNVYVV